MQQRTLIVVKPHAVERGLVGNLLARFENMGLKIISLKMFTGSPDLWEIFYPSDENWLRNAGTKTSENCKANKIDPKEVLGTDDLIEIGKLVKNWLVDHMSSGECVAAILEGNEALSKVRATCGNTLPNLAVPGTIRFDFSTDSPSLAIAEKRPVYNLIHASDPDEVRNGKKSVDYEIDVIFPELSNADMS